MSDRRLFVLVRHLAATLFVFAIAGCAVEAVPTAADPEPAGGAGEEIVVYRSQSCQCCKEHITHLEEAGFAVRDEVVEDVGAVKARLGVPDDMQSCHTSVVGDYFIEGHVPAGVITELLGERPEVDGLALPGMPPGAPGMPGEPEPLTVLAVTDGDSAVYAVR